jgi:hypothetical protein
MLKSVLFLLVFISFKIIFFVQLNFGFTKHTETNAKQILFRFVSVRTEIIFFRFEDTLVPDNYKFGMFQLVIFCTYDAWQDVLTGVGLAVAVLGVLRR